MIARIVFVALVMTGCGDDDRPPVDDDDAAVDATMEHDAGADVTDVEVAPPAAPAVVIAPNPEPCPARFTLLTDRAPRCAGLEVDEVPTCEGATHLVPGHDGCVTVGSACPEGNYADVPEGALFVSESGAAEGDGTREAPFREIAQALRASSSGATIAVAPGTYRDTLFFLHGARVVGACASGTIINPYSDSAPSIQIMTLEDVAIENITVRSADDVGVDIPGGHVTLDGVVLEDTSGRALHVRDARVEVSDTAIRRMTSGFSPGAALSCERSTCSLRDVSFEAIDGSAAEIGEGSELDAEGVFVRWDPALVSADETFRHEGFLVSGGSTATVRASVFREVDTALLAEAATLTLEHVEIRDAAFAAVLVFEPTSIVTIRKSAVIASNLGVLAADLAQLNVEDSVFVDAVPRQPGAGTALASVPAMVHVERVLVAGAPELGVAVSTGGLFEGRDLRVEDIRAGAGVGIGMHALGGAFDLERVEIENIDVIGALFEDSPGSTIRDLTIRAVGNDIFGVGLYVTSSILTVERTRIDAVNVAGMTVSGATANVVATDLSIRNTRSDGAGLFGRGIEISDGSMTGQRVLVSHTRDIGVLAFRGDVTLSDVVIEDTAARVCAASTCSDAPFGLGGGAYQGGHLTLERFRVSRASLCGLHLDDQGAIDLRHGLVEESYTGVCVEEPNFDLDRVTEDVRFEGNERAIESEMLPVPDLAPTPPE